MLKGKVLIAEFTKFFIMLKHVGVLTVLLCFLNISNSEIISTTTGDISGTTINVLGNPVVEYLGIPYAEPPVGELRFKPPVPIKPWKGVLNATQNPSPCIQIGCSDCSEDCLFINIWVPKNTTATVMVWFHGGGFMFGSINKRDVDGSIFSSVGRVIFASVSYRLGPFGFMYSGTEDAPGNAGIKDQILGLRWIKDNLRAFGGDPSKITIFGHSSGATSVFIHLISPLSRDLFKSAIMQSGPSINSFVTIRNTSLIKWRSTETAVKSNCASEGQDIANDPKVMSCMRNMSAFSINTAEMIVAISIYLSDINPSQLFFTPVYGDDCIPQLPLQEILEGNIDVGSFMIGTVADEGSSFLLIFANPFLAFFDHPITTEDEAYSYIIKLFRGQDNPPAEVVANYYLGNTSSTDNSLLKRAYDSVGDWVFDCPSVYLSESSSSYGKNVYHYVYTHRSSNSKYREWMGVAHGEDVDFIFGAPLRNDSSYTPEEKEFCKELIEAWTSFAITGKPSYRKLSEEWPLYNNVSRLAVDLNPYNVSYRNPFKDACRFWKSYIFNDVGNLLDF